MVNFSRSTLQGYLDQLSRKKPVPGGGSAAALTAALGAGLVSMVANYSIGRKSNTAAVEKRLTKTLQASEAMRKRLLQLATLDSKAYLKIVAARKSTPQAQRKAGKEAAAVGKEACLLCYKILDLIPFLVVKGNPYLISDLEAAAELLQAGFNASMVMVRINQ